MTLALNAWMNGEWVGTWSVGRSGHSFVYTESWTQSPKARSLSLSLPITASRQIRGPVVESFFENLLPDSQRIRERLGRRFKTNGIDAFSLLQAIGRDCVGAVQLLPQDVSPQGWDRMKCEPLSDSRIAKILRAVPTAYAFGDLDDDEHFRISIAGAQEKTALVQVKGRWCKPLGATPTTHILKLPMGLVGGSRQVDLNDSVENEWLCMQIVGELGLPVAATNIRTFEEQKVLVVERFDRQSMDSGRWIARLPQEDFCQALGIPPSRKYEVDGGPGTDDCLKLLSGSSEPLDAIAFQLTQFAFWLLAATDGHAKNYSVFLYPGDSFALTPVYDVLSMWPYFGTAHNKFDRRKAKLAMALRATNAHYRLAEIQARHWKAMAMNNGGQPVWDAMLELARKVDPALKAVEKRLPRKFPEHTWQAIASGTREQAQRFTDAALVLR